MFLKNPSKALTNPPNYEKKGPSQFDFWEFWISETTTR